MIKYAKKEDFNLVKNKVDNMKAVDVGITDAGGIYEATNVEDALAEVAMELKEADSLGKTIIAEAIGTPLTPEQNFVQMGAGVDTLTNEFKAVLNEKGISTTNDDKMKTLIGRVADISGGVDVIVKNVLPNVVKNGQIVIISNNTPNKILFDFNYPLSNNENDIFIKLKDVASEEFIVVKDNKKEVYVYFSEVKQYIGNMYNSVDTYIGVDGTWTKLFDTLKIFSNGMYSSATNIFSYSSSSGAGNYGVSIVDSSDLHNPNSLYFKSGHSNSSADTNFSLNEKINVIGYSKLIIRENSSLNANNTGKVRYSLSRVREGYSSELLASVDLVMNSQNERMVELDISNVDVECYIKVSFYGSSSGYNLYVNEFELVR